MNVNSLSKPLVLFSHGFYTSGPPPSSLPRYPSGPSLTATPFFNAFLITPAGCNFSSSLFTSCIVFPALSIPPVRPQTSSLPSTFSGSHHLWSNYCFFPVLPAFCLAPFSLFSTLKYLFQKTDMIMSATGLNVPVIANTY